MIPFRANRYETPLIKSAKSLQDAINTILSNFTDNMQEDARNTILVLVNYDGENLGSFRQNLSTYGAVKVTSVDGVQGDVKTLQVSVNADNYKAILEVLKKAMIENCMGYDAKDDRMSGTPNEMNIQSMYNDIDMDASTMEAEFQAALEQLLWFVKAHLANTGAGDFEDSKVTFVFNRNMIMNQSELINNARNSEGLVSDETILAHHPWVTDVAAELEEFKWDVNTYIDRGMENAIDGAWMKELENASARAHITRLEAFSMQIRAILEEAYGKYYRTTKNALTAIYETEYYHTAFEVQKGIGVAGTFNSIDKNAIEKVINTPWSVDGKEFSARIWEDRMRMIGTMRQEITRQIATGDSPDEAIKALTKEVKKDIKNARQKADTLVMTESAAIGNRAQHDCYKELGVEEYIIIETLDSHTCEYCVQMDYKHYPMTQFQIGSTAPPFHPNCRGCTAPYFDDEFQPKKRAARDPETGKTVQVDNMTYSEWKEEYITQPYKAWYDTFEGEVTKELKTYSTSMNSGNQSKHVRGSHNFDPARSELTADPQMLYNSYSGNGEFLHTVTGEWNHKERFTHTGNIGIYKRGRADKGIPTNTGIIHYSKRKGWHIVPARPRKEETR